MYEDIVSESLKARRNSYCPYSHFAVGAALLCGSGKVYTGCNIESAAFTPTCCAERLAFYKAVEAGEREFTAIAVCGAPEGTVPDVFCMPCGVCREVMREFCGSGFTVISVIDEKTYKAFAFDDILPNSFKGL